MTTSNDDILRALGRVEEGVRRLQEDFRDEKQAAHESRAAIHARLDEQVDRINRLDTTVAISGQVDAQIRGEIRDLKETVDNNHEAVQPAVEDWRRVKMLGAGISMLMLAVGVTAGTVYTVAYDWFSGLLRHWLKIP